MALSDDKKHDLFEFYLQNGFDISTNAIIENLKISHKTFFNRYQSKEESIQIAWNYWQKLCYQRWNEVKHLCNHSVEEILMLLHSINQSCANEPIYYEYTRNNKKYLEKDSFFYKSVHSTLQNGKQKFHIRETLNLDLYICFLLDNLFFNDNDKLPEIMKFVLHPALTERGMELFEETAAAWK